MWPTILVSAVLVAILTAIVVCWIKRKKSGKSSCSCGGNCGACGLCGVDRQKKSCRGETENASRKNDSRP